MVLVDANVLLDVLTNDAVWAEWSQGELSIGRQQVTSKSQLGSNRWTEKASRLPNLHPGTWRLREPACRVSLAATTSLIRALIEWTRVRV